MDIIQLMKKLILALLACAFIVLCYFALPKPLNGEVQIGETLREANLTGLTGPDKPLSSYRGKPLVINVWASWCGPCREEMGSIQLLANRYDGNQFNVIGISTDDFRDRASAFMKDSNTTFANFIDKNLELETMLGANKIPLTLLVDADGKVLDKIHGAHDWASPEALALIQDNFHIRM